MIDGTIQYFSSITSLIDHLSDKYENVQNRVGSSYRYPGAIIFFESQQDYLDFIQKAPWAKTLLSDSISQDPQIKCYKAEQWLKSALVNAKEKPLIILPLTEYIRFCRKQILNLEEKIFSQILLAEYSKIIVPMCDYYANFSFFLDKFPHQREHKATTYIVRSERNESDQKVTLILDKTGKLVKKSDQFKISNIHDWMQLWEEGTISSLDNILVQNSPIINAIGQCTISLPKVECININNEKEFFQYEFSLDRNSFSITPTDYILEYILSYFQRHKNTSWAELVSSVLTHEKPFENLISDLWNEGNKNKIGRWFWLNEAKKINFKSEFLNLIINKVQNPEQLIDEAYFFVFDEKKINVEISRERQKFLQSLKNPLIQSDLDILEKKYRNMYQTFSNDKIEVLNRSSGIFEFEFLIIFETTMSLIKEDKTIPLDLIDILSIIWPSLYSYISSIKNVEVNISDLKENFYKFSTAYINLYIYSKVLFDCPTKELEKTVQECKNHWNEIIASLKIGNIPSFNNHSIQEKIHKNDWIFLDGVGYEWNNLIISLLQKKGWTIVDSNAIFSNLPTITEVFNFNNSLKEYRNFDNNLHESYSYPQSIIKEIRILESIIDEIHQRYRKRNRKIILVSDHGATAFTRKMKPLNIPQIQYEHSGRCAKIGKDISSQISKNENTAIVSFNNDSYVISLIPNSISNRSPFGEAHGGGLPEEFLSIMITLLPPGYSSEIANIIEINLEKEEITPLDQDLIFNIFNADPSSMENISISINNNQLVKLQKSFISSERVQIPVSFMKDNGLIVGTNYVKITIEDQIMSCKVRFSSGSDQTEFNSLFE